MHHRRDRAAAAVIHTRDIHVKQPLPDGRVEIRQQPVDRDAGVVHQQVHRSNFLEHGFDSLSVAHIGADGHAAGLRGDRLGGRAGLNIVHVYRPAVAGQRQRGRLADAAGRSGHECDFFHVKILPETNICQNAASMLLYTCFFEIAIHPVDPGGKNMSRQTTTRRRHGVRRMSERKRLTITAISAVLALVTVVICALSGVFNFHKGNERILPNLVGQTEESAKAQLAELDAEPSITYENSDETKGIVIRQDVNEGTQLKHRQTVAFVVSLGPKEQPTAPEDTPVAIPSFVGLTLEQAQATAKSLGVTIEESGTVYDDNVRKGSVARQNPVGGTMVKPGTTIQVSISAGQEKKEHTVTVTCGAGGSVSPSGNQKVAEGGSVSFTITPKDGYEVATLVIDGTTVLPLTSYSFMNVDSNHTLYVTFREK